MSKIEKHKLRCSIRVSSSCQDAKSAKRGFDIFGVGNKSVCNIEIMDLIEV